jgi:predicted anti-sigma-YlaC factor YlaD
MNCTSAQRLISAARDGALDGSAQSALDAHLAECPACRQMRDTLAASAAAWRSTTVAVPLPDAKLEWQRIQRRLSPDRHPPRARRPVLWWGLSLAAAAGLALAVWVPGPAPAGDAEFVEVGEGSSSATVYVDAQSGWLVVWAVRDADRI